MCRSALLAWPYAAMFGVEVRPGLFWATVVIGATFTAVDPARRPRWRL
jgi:hypothetical protein